ncbi:Predicted protein [Komagataella phaffii CBS 7435]|nr:Predicted protein [Komagataella phaffii CBS 7435]
MIPVLGTKSDELSKPSGLRVNRRSLYSIFWASTRREAIDELSNKIIGVGSFFLYQPLVFTGLIFGYFIRWNPVGFWHMLICTNHNCTCHATFAARPRQGL